MHWGLWIIFGPSLLVVVVFVLVLVAAVIYHVVKAARQGTLWCDIVSPLLFAILFLALSPLVCAGLIIWLVFGLLVSEQLDAAC